MKRTEKGEAKEARFGNLLSHRRIVFLVCLGYTKNYEEAEELTQDIYVRIWQKLEAQPTDGSSKAWLITITRNRCVDYIRKMKVRNLFAAGRSGPHYSLTDENTPEKISLMEDDRIRLKECIAKLPEKLRSVFVLKEYSGLRGEEIAKILGIRTGTVHSRLNRARQRVKNEMGVLNE